MSKLKCIESDDYSCFVPGRAYEYDEKRETVTGDDLADWYYETPKPGVIALCGLNVYFEVCDD